MKPSYDVMSLVRRCGCFLLPALSVLMITGCSSVDWESDYEKGVQRAVEQSRRALVYFWEPLDMDCQDMEEVFEDPKVQEQMHGCIAIRLSKTLNPKLAEQFNVQTVPSFFIIRPDMTLAQSHAGRMDLDKFQFFLFRGLSY